MKLLIISNMAHYLRDGQLVGHGPTAREISAMAALFDEITHIGCLYQGASPNLALPYTTDKLRFVGLPPAGGERFLDKLLILFYIPLYIATILRYLPRADVVHVRAPANIPLIALLLLSVVRRPKLRWLKYAGNWKPDVPDARSYRIQRWMLRRGWHRGQVTVNGQWLGDRSFVHGFLNPCLTEEEVMEGQVAARSKTMATPVRLILVGWMLRSKGVERALRVAALLRADGVAISLDLIGDGHERQELEALAASLGLDDCVTFHGWLARTDLAPFYTRAHLMLFPTNSEGWPKVISEAMAYGVVPLASAVSAIPQYLTEFQTGMAIPAEDIEAYAAAIRAYAADPARWQAESKRAVEAAARFTYAHFLQDVRALLDLPPT
ncbi:MAG: glycosyltransferase [Anaerolineae bacterium]|nr:glycosyltransferase [Anaerolineae bacterium]